MDGARGSGPRSGVLGKRASNGLSKRAGLVTLGLRTNVVQKGLRIKRPRLPWPSHTCTSGTFLSPTLHLTEFPPRSRIQNMSPTTTIATAEKSSPDVADILSPAQPIQDDGLKNFGEVRETREVFKAHVDGVEFRTVSWQRAAILFLKIQFAMSILAVPSTLAALGAVGGALSIVGWGTLNACEFSSRSLISSS